MTIHGGWLGHRLRDCGGSVGMPREEPLYNELLCLDLSSSPTSNSTLYITHFTYSSRLFAHLITISYTASALCPSNFFFFFASRRRFYSPTFYGRYCFSHSLQPSLSLILPVLRFRINSTLHLQFLSPTSPNTSYSIFYAKPGDPSKKKDDPLLSQHFLTFTNL